MDPAAQIDHVQLPCPVFSEGGNSETGLEQHHGSRSTFARGSEGKHFTAAKVAVHIRSSKRADRAAAIDISADD